MSPPPHVSGMLIDVLDPQIYGCPHGQIPAEGEPNTFRGLLDWKKRNDSILAPTIYSATAGVQRKITTLEMAQVMDFPVCRTEQMKETDLRLLIDGDVPGKVIQGAIYFLAQWKTGIETPLPVKRSLDDSEDQPTSKRAKADDGPPLLEGKMVDEEGEEEGKEGLEEDEMKSEGGVLEFDDYDEALVEEAESQKATRSDDAGISVHLWDDRIQQKLTEHWSLRSNLKGHSIKYYQRTFEDPVDKSKLKDALQVLRRFALQIWKRILRKDFASWFETTDRHHKERDEIALAGKEVVDRALKASWWEWDYGSSLFFWR